MQKLKTLIKRFTPKFFLLFYHFAINLVAIIIYRHPSRKLIVIGVTGTKGKTSTSILLHTALKSFGIKAGLLSTAEIRIGDKNITNSMHMTLKGRGYAQRMLREMVDAGCEYAVVETPSEGIAQFRSFGIKYDAVVFTNLSPEHLVTHKTFERYMKTKGRLFKAHAMFKPKKLNGKRIKKLALINANDKEFEYFENLVNANDTKLLRFGFGDGASETFEILEEGNVTKFRADGKEYITRYPGRFYLRNLLPAVLILREYLNAKPETFLSEVLKESIPGRIEEIKEGQNFKVIVDYAHEPLSIRSILEIFKTPNGKVISVVGAVGASRWKYNAEEIGKAAKENSEIVIITDIDPFKDDPNEIIEAVFSGSLKVKGGEVYKILDRREGIKKAFSLAQAGDVVVITGKGAEVTMEVKSGSIPWDEREIIRSLLKKN